MKKNERITQFVADLQADKPVREGPLAALDPHYTGYFTCFNAGDYYEAHDVLEHLWLQVHGPEHTFYKGLIQLAGAFVHLRKQYERPTHPKDGRRLRPAVRLFHLSERNLAHFRPRHMYLDVAAICTLSHQLAENILDSGFASNPWSLGELPQIRLTLEP